MIDPAFRTATFNDCAARALEIADDRRREIFALPFEERAERSDEARDLSLAITHLEDALTRYNSSRYRASGVWHRNDPDL